MKYGYLIVCCCIVLAGGCGKGVPPSEESTKTEPEATAKTGEQPAVSYENVVVASGKTTTAQLFVEKSIPATPGTKVDLVDVSVSPPQVIVSGATLQSARWKVPGPFQSPKYPASGFVTFSLAENQWAAMKGKDMAVQPANR